jgi:hypothetical protein
MQQLGHVMNPRDERGWMIPRPNTKRRKIYDALVAGKKAGEIMRELGMSRKAYSSHQNIISRWEITNRLAYEGKHR